MSQPDTFDRLRAARKKLLKGAWPYGPGTVFSAEAMAEAMEESVDSFMAGDLINSVQRTLEVEIQLRTGKPCWFRRIDGGLHVISDEEIAELRGDQFAEECANRQELIEIIRKAGKPKRNDNGEK